MLIKEPCFLPAFISWVLTVKPTQFTSCWSSLKDQTFTQWFLQGNIYQLFLTLTRLHQSQLLVLRKFLFNQFIKLCPQHFLSVSMVLTSILHMTSSHSLEKELLTLIRVSTFTPKTLTSASSPLVHSMKSAFQAYVSFRSIPPHVSHSKARNFITNTLINQYFSYKFA